MSERLEELFERLAKRCPVCEGANFTSDNCGNHKCLDCSHRFTDKTALPSREAMLRAKARAAATAKDSGEKK